MRTIIKVTSVFILMLTVQFAYASEDKIPVKDFFKNPEFTALQLSPDGKKIAVISPMGKTNSRNIAIMDTEGLKNIKYITGLTNRDVRGYFWANNKDIVLTMDKDGDESFSLYKVDITDKKLKLKTLVFSLDGRSATTVSRLPSDPENIIVQYNGRKITAPDLYKLPLDSEWSKSRKKNSKMKRIAKNPGDVQGWVLDNEGVVRGAYSIKGLKGKFHYKEKGEDEFRVLREFNIEDEGISPLGFDFDDKTMYVSSNIGRDRAAVYKFDPKKNQLGEMIYGHDVVDVNNIMMSRHQKKLIGVAYIDDYPETVYFDKATEKLMKGLHSAFPGKRVNITSQSDNEDLSIVFVNDDIDPGNYYLFEKSKNNLVPIVGRMSWLNPDKLSPMKPIQFTSRDGLDIRGYITVPKQTGGKKLPLIVNPHGGPFGVRDIWGFNPEHQFFASRGYATVQVNYRGSGGYGREFQQAGYNGKWGAEMQNDLTDAVKYLVAEGIVDPERVCIYGASYGGYATMAGLTFTPDLYKCGINYVGVTDVGLLFTSMPKYWEPQKEVMKGRIGDPDDKELMKRMSPLAHVDKIKAPLMIVQGARDPRVVKQHATDLRDALEDRGITLSDDEWIMKLDEGHGFSKEENKIELYTKMEKFLAKHL